VKRPAFQFYPSDWRKDMALQNCSIAARGLWIEMLCIAHECEPYGHLTVNGKPMTAAQIGRHAGLTERECAKLIAELEAAGVLSRTEEGSIFSRRMVRDEDVRNRRAEGGKAGSEHGIKGAEHGRKGGRPPAGRGVSKPPSEPPKEPPPSSSSSSSSSEEEKARKRAAPVARPPDVAEQVWSDWLELRKAKRAPVTQTTLDGAITEAAKAGMSLEAFLRVWCRRGSQGLEADWLKPDERGRSDAAEAPEPEWRREQRERNEAALGPYAATRRAKPNVIDINSTEDFDAPSRLLG
jgi:hypothetical protein